MLTHVLKYFTNAWDLDRSNNPHLNALGLAVYWGRNKQEAALLIFQKMDEAGVPDEDWMKPFSCGITLLHIVAWKNRQKFFRAKRRFFIEKGFLDTKGPLWRDKTKEGGWKGGPGKTWAVNAAPLDWAEYHNYREMAQLIKDVVEEAKAHKFQEKRVREHANKRA